MSFALMCHGRICQTAIDFDQGKSERNEIERGFGFGSAARIFFGRTVTYQDERADYGEVGEIDGKLYKVVYTDRENVRRIISAPSRQPAGGAQMATLRMTMDEVAVSEDGQGQG